MNFTILKLVAGRIVAGLGSLLAVSAVVFAVTAVLPGDAAQEKLGQEATHRGGSAVDVRQAPEQVHAVERDAVGDADEPDVPARAGGVEGLIHRLLRADGLDHGVGAEPVGELLDRRDALLAARFDDVGRAELASQSLARLVAAHGNDPLGAELLGRQHGEQADGAVTDHGHRLARAGLGRHRAEPAGAEHVGRGEEARDEVVGRDAPPAAEGSTIPEAGVSRRPPG